MDSTHEYARRMIESGEIGLGEEGVIPLTVVSADAQTDARDRRDRPWVTLPGSSFGVSLITVLPATLVGDDRVNGWLPMIAGLAALDGLENALDECEARPYDPDCGFMLKWPNDIYCNGLKIGGTFTQTVPLAGDPQSTAVIFSIGINLTMPADRLPTPRSTSLQMHVSRLPPVARLRDLIAVRLVESLRARLEAFVDMPLVQGARLRSEIRHVCWMMGRPIEARLADGSVLRGEVTALNDDASVGVRTPDGDTVALRLSDVGAFL